MQTARRMAPLAACNLTSLFSSVSIFSVFFSFYRPQQYLWKGNVFISICLSTGMHGKGEACVAKGGMCGKDGACMMKGGMCGKGGGCA